MAPQIQIQYSVASHACMACDLVSLSVRDTINERVFFTIARLIFTYDADGGSQRRC